MAKQQQSIRDFSGGINRGSNKKNLKDNQLVESKNFISDSIGQLTTIQGTSYISTNSLNKVLPDGNQKNIHSWSTDTGFDLNQANNLAVPTVTELQVEYKSRIRFYHSTDYGFRDTKSLILNNLDRDEVVFNWDNSTPNSSYSQYTDLEAQGYTVKTLESLANQKTSGSHADESTIPWKWNTYTSQQGGVSFAEEASGSDHISTTTPSSNNDGSSNQFVVKKITDTDFGSDVSNYPVWMMELVFDYYGKINWGLDGNWTQSVVRPSGVQEPDNLVELKWEDFLPVSESTQVFNRATGALLFNSPNASYVYGAFSKWRYNIVNIPANKQFDYTIVVEVWKNIGHTSSNQETLSYTNVQGETVDDVIAGLFGGTGLGEGEIVSSAIGEDHQVYWKRVEEGVEIFQDARTPKPYGIKNITVSRTNEVTINQSAGDKHSHLVAVGNSNSQASVYATDTDQWTDYQIDLRVDESDNSNNSDIGFFDSEGYLNVCDMSFRANNKPKWFGYLSYNKTYLEADLMNPNFTVTDLAPVPYERLVDSGSVAQVGTTNNYHNQWSHMAFDVKDMVNFFDPIGLVPPAIFGRSGGTNDEDTSKIAVRKIISNDLAMDEVGLKAYIQFFDASGTNDTDNNTAGTFNKTNSVELYFSYVYKGGYVSRPKRFQVDATNGSTNYQSTASAEDGRAMGIVVGIGRQLIDSDGTNAFNERLQSIEIWAKYTESDPSNIYLVTEIDLNKGWRSNLSGDWKPLSSLTISSQLKGYTTGNWPTSGSTYTHYKRSNYLIFTSPNTIESFYQRYGLDYKDPIGFDSAGTGWKTACIFNRRAYYGNIQIRGKDDTITYKPDGILKSAPGNYLTVGLSNLIEATINDGDEITSLQVVGNKLCQFKKNSLAIMGVKILENGESREFIEQIVHHVGILSENQVTQTPYGLFWVSRSGVYIYNGESVQRLTDSPEGSTISKQEWESFYGERLHIGYDAYWNQVLIARDLQNNNETLIYSFNNKAFSTSNDLFNSSKKSGFAKAKNGQLIWAEEFNNTGSSGVTGSKNNMPKNKQSVGFTDAVQAVQQNNLTP